MLAGGERVDYDALLLATGAEPRRPPDPRRRSRRRPRPAHASRTPTRCARCSTPAGGSWSIGAGWIGCEVAASARQRGHGGGDGGAAVGAAGGRARPRARRLLPRRARRARRGAAPGHGVEAIEGDGRAERVRTSDGAVLECRPRCCSASASRRAPAGRGRARRRQRDPRRRLAARERRRRLRGRRRRQPRPSAVRAPARRALGQRAGAGPVAARAMLGQDVVYERVPYFFSDQYDVGMEYAGHARPATRSSSAATRPRASSSPSGCATGASTAGMNVNVWDVNEHHPGARALGADGRPRRVCATPTCPWTSWPRPSYPASHATRSTQALCLAPAVSAGRRARALTLLLDDGRGAPTPSASHTKEHPCRTSPKPSCARALDPGRPHRPRLRAALHAGPRRRRHRRAARALGLPGARPPRRARGGRGRQLRRAGLPARRAGAREPLHALRRRRAPAAQPDLGGRPLGAARAGADGPRRCARLRARARLPSRRDRPPARRRAPPARPVARHANGR